MTTELLFQKDSYLKEFESEITKIDNNSIYLAKTAFYPTGGGQPNDIGTLQVGSTIFNVVDVKKEGSEVQHIVKENPSNDLVGQKVAGKIDWETRYKYQRTHTAMHILCGIIYQEFNSTVTGGQIKALEGRMDFDIEKFTPDKIKFIEERCNEAINKNYPIKVEFLDRAEADKDPELIRTKVSLIPKEVKTIRTVDIVGLDKQADSGTHVKSTKEVGIFTISKIDNKGKGRKRIYFTLN